MFKGVIRFSGRLYVLKKANIKQKILFETHLTLYSEHNEIIKMYRDLKQSYAVMKKDII